MADVKLDRTALQRLNQSLLEAAKMDTDKAAIVAELLVQTDEIGVWTHGTAMVPNYVAELEAGTMATTGGYEVLKDTGPAMVWDGQYQHGLWLIPEAIKIGTARARKYGISTIAVKQSHHIGCLAVLMRLVTDAGLVCIITTSDPGGAWVAPFGGLDPVFTPNPIGVGYPAAGAPVLIDTCASITTVSKLRDYADSGRKFDANWLQDGHGQPSNDPAVVNQTPKGTLLPTGGQDHGHKGYGLALMVEMLTQGLTGYGRKDKPARWGANVFLQIMDPALYGGAEAFSAQVNYVNDLCRA
ncbi:MAG: Ldh family oxidoreductase, partial [Rhodobacteraceae bacterium]|nr:Ldh family oxidoreductase [Paracoccaceae bacterium]